MVVGYRILGLVNASDFEEKYYIYYFRKLVFMGFLSVYHFVQEL
jgi:hypothetical protein